MAFGPQRYPPRFGADAGKGYMMQQLFVKKLRDTAILPSRATPGSAGYALYADLPSALVIHPQEIVKVPTGIAVAIPDSEVVGLIYARSGLASKYGIAPANCVGVVDSDYRGELLVPLANHSPRAYVIEPGDRVAQLVLAPVYLPELCEVEELDETARGSGGFGSTNR